MKKTTFLKSLLLAAMVGVGANAQADAGDVTTNADINFSNPITDGVVAGTVNSMTIGATTNSVTEIAGDEGAKYLFLGDATNTVTIPEAQRAGNKDVVTVQFDLGLTDGQNNHTSFYIKDAEGNNIAYMKCALWDASSSNETNLGIALNTTTFNKNSSNPKDALWNKRTSFTITFDYLNSTITTVTQIQGATALEPIVVNMANKNPIATFAISSVNPSGGADRRAKFGNLLIKTTEGDYSVAAADYTVNWKNGKTVVKTETRSGNVGSTIELAAADKQAFEEGGVRYLYVEDDAEGKTIVEGGSTVITINIRTAVKYGYTFNAVDEEDHLLATLGTGSVYEDQNTATVRTPWYLLYNETLYSKSGSSASETITTDGQIVKVTYTATEITNIVFYAEGENINGGAWIDIANASNGAAARALNSANFASVDAGKYKIYSRFVVGNGKTGDTYATDPFTVGEKALKYDVPAKTITTYTSEEFMVTDETDLYVTFAGSSISGVDYIYVQRTGDAVVPATITNAGWATLYTNAALDFSGIEGLTAYTATCSNNEVTLTEVNNVPANTGVVLKGAAATYSIPAIASSTTDKGHLLGSATEATAWNAYEGYTLYMLNIVDGKAQFVPVTSDEIAAGKAFLKIASGNSSLVRSLNVVFGEDATGINAVNAQQSANEYYNLRGQRVAAPQKGLYIVNGKKVVVK